MSTNKNLTRDIVTILIKEQDVVCPNCGKEKLNSRYTYKKQNIEYICPVCKEIYHPCKLI